MKKSLLGLILSITLLVGFSPALLQAATLTQEQIQAVTAMVRSFGASETVAKSVQASLGGKVSSNALPTSAQTLPKTDRPIASIPNEPGDVDPGSDDTACTALTTNLRYRMSDRAADGQVSLLQDFLQTSGYLNQEPSGFFGVLTLQAVKKFQKSVGLSPTGFVGSLTRGKIKELTCGGGVIIPPEPRPGGNIKVISPNGGETWTKGTTQTIKWQDNSTNPPCQVGMACTLDVQALRIYDLKLAPYYPPCTGQICPKYAYREPYVIAKGIRGSSYSWNVGEFKAVAITNSQMTTAPDGSYTIQICQSGTSVCDSSDSYFKIVSEGNANNPPKIVTSPPLPGAIQPGQTVKFHWKAVDEDNDDLSWSVSFGESGSASSCSITRRRGGTGWEYSTSYVWSRPGTYVVKAAVTDCVGGSDSTSFTVTVGSASQNLPPVIDGVSGPTTLTPGETGTWNVKAHDPENGNLSYIVNWGDGVNSGSTMRASDAPLSVSASQTTTFTHSYSTAGTYKVSFTVTDNKGLTAQSTISVQVGAIQPSITVTYPKGGENMVTGDPMLIRWTPTVSVSVIEIVSTAGNYSFGIYGPKYGNTAPITSGEYTYTVVNTTPAGTYYVRITPADGSAQALSKTFTINQINQPSITVLSPNGGEIWPVGSTQTMRWNNTSGGPVNITLSNYLSCWNAVPACMAPAIIYPLAANVSGLSYNWTAGKTQNGSDIPAGEYKVTVSSATNGSITDQSDSAFTITATSTSTTSLN